MIEMLTYISPSSGIGGTIKENAEDFIVEEIMPDGKILELNKKTEKEGEGEFCHFVLQKKNWTTASALKEISKRLRISQKRMSSAGTKDRVALTTQLASAFAVPPSKLKTLNIKDITINGAWSASDKVRLGELLGNRFRIKVTGCKENPEGKIEKIKQELNGKFPNYYGEQRFGTTRKNTHLIGEKMLKSQFEDAAMEFLANSDGEINESAKQARKELSETHDFSLAFRNFPKHLRLERSMLLHLSDNPNDYINAFRKLPRSILLLFVHAFQSHLFNLEVSERIREKAFTPEENEYFCETDTYGFPDINKKSDSGWLAISIIGSESNTTERQNKLLEKFDVRKEDFNIRSIPEISSKGNFRTMFAPLKDFSFKEKEFNFSLPSGCYATTALREFICEKKK